LHEEHTNILKTNIADILQDSEFRGFSIGNYTKKIKVEFSYKPNEEVLSEYSLDPFLLELHNHYLNKNSEKSANKDHEYKNSAKAFKIEIDSNENFGSINKAFMRRKYNEKVIIPNDSNKNAKDFLKENLLNKLTKGKTDGIFIDKTTVKNPNIINIDNDDNLLLSEKDIKFNRNDNIDYNESEKAKDYLEYFTDKEDLKHHKKEASVTEKFNFNNEFKRIYSQIDSEKADFLLDKNKDLEDFFERKDSEMNFLRKDSQISNATSEKMIINVENEDAEQLQINSNENSNNFLLKSFSGNLKNLNSYNNYFENANMNNDDNYLNFNFNASDKMDIEGNQDNNLILAGQKSQSGLFDFGKYAKFESLFNLRKNSNEFDVNLLNKKSLLDSRAEKNNIDYCNLFYFIK
jgi:hypothetical protein